MDNLKEIIQTFSENDKKEFKAFINRLKKKSQRKDLDLFVLLDSNEDLEAEQVLKKMYPDGKKEAYHALRKRLFRHLTDFIVTKQMQEDATAASLVMGLLSLSRYLFEQDCERLAWRYLKKAEQQARSNEQYDLLNAVYNLQIEKSDSEFSDDLEEIIRKRNENKQLKEEDERANIANSIIRKELKRVRLEGKPVDIDKIITEVLEKYQLTEAVFKRPKLMYKLMSIARSAILVKKEFYSFEPFIINQYNNIKQQSGFRKKDHFYKLSLLYMIAHTLYRNKKFEEAEKYLVELEKNLHQHNKSYYVQFYPKYVMLLSAICMFTGNYYRATELLEFLLYESGVKLSKTNYLNAILNLSLYSSQLEHFERANEILLSLAHTDKWCEKIMGKEWVLKKNMIEAMLQYELDNHDIALNRIRSIERNFADIFKIKRYQRVKTFVGIIKQYISNPDLGSSKSFHKKVEQSFRGVPAYREDIQAIGFYTWLKAKMENRKYYDVLLELMGNTVAKS